MAKTISATVAAKRMREVLNAIESEGETFRVERHGRPVAEIGPTAGGGRSRWGEVQAALRRGPAPDAAFERDLAALRATVGSLPEDPWAPSSTRQS